MEMVDGANVMTDPVQSAVCPKCGASLDVEGLAPFTLIQCPSCQMEFPVPVKFGPFLLLQLLGAGGMGGVYRAKDEGLNREVAVKVMLKTLGDDPQFVETFQREAQAAAKLNHPNIAQIYSFGQEKGQPYIAMELVAGGSLDKMMKQGPMDPVVVLHIGEQIAEGLKEAADAGLVHGDVKPENILFDADKNAKLVDFGLAAMQSGGPNAEIWGTPYYISPEKCRRQKCDFRADIYSLGGTLYHAIAGKPPFDGPDATAVVKARFDGPAKPLSEVRGGVDPEVDALIARMLELDPAKRYPTYGSLLGDMRRYLGAHKPVDLKTKSKKFVIKGSAAAFSASQSSAIEDPASTPVDENGFSLDPLPEGMQPISPDDGEEEEEIKKRGCKLFAMIGGGILLGAALITGGVFWYLSSASENAIRTDYRSQESVQTKTRAAIQGYVKQADDYVKRMALYPDEALKYAKEASALVLEALGDSVSSRLVPPEPEYRFPDEKTQTPPVAEASAVGGTNQTAAAGASNVVSAVSNQVDKVASTNAGVNVATAPEKAAAEPAPAVEAAVEEVAPAENDPSAAVVKRVQEMYQEVYKVKYAALYAQKIRDNIVALVESASKIVSPTEITKESVVEMQETTKKLADLNKEVNDQFNLFRSTREFSEVGRRVSMLKKTVESIRADIASLLALRQQEKLAAEKKAKEEAEKARQAEEAQKLKELVAAEKEKVSACENSIQEYLLKLDFRNASRILKNLAEELKTDEGRDFLVTARERVNRLQDFHEFMVASCKEGYKSAKGWATTAADKRSLMVGGQRTPWLEVYTKRAGVVMELINGLIDSDAARKKMKLREHSRAMTNAALFLRTFYRDNSSAQKRAADLVTKAAEEFELDADLMKQLIPEAFE